MGKFYDGDLEGVSAVVLSTQKGKEIFGSIYEKFVVKEHFLDEVLIAQSCSKEHIENKKIERSDFRITENRFITRRNNKKI